MRSLPSLFESSVKARGTDVATVVVPPTATTIGSSTVASLPFVLVSVQSCEVHPVVVLHPIMQSGGRGGKPGDCQLVALC